MNLLKKKVVWIPVAIILFFILYGTSPNVMGALVLVGSLAGGAYLYLKNERFKARGKAFKVVTTIGLLLFLITFGIGGLTYDSAQVEQNRLAAEKAKVEQQLEKEKEEQKAKEEQAKKDEEEKIKAEQEVKKTEEAKKKAEAEEKAKSLAKFNLKEVTVSRVVDGDTVELSDGSKVRLIGVNTPESTTRTEPYGKESSDYTKNQLTNKTVYLEKDVSETDKYGRLLRYVWLDIPKEISDSEIRTKMYNAILTAEGYAEASTYPPDVKYSEYFRKYAGEARDGKKGIWAIDPNGTTKGDGDKVASASSNNSSTSNPNGSTSTSNNSSNNTQSPVVPQQEPVQKGEVVYWLNTKTSYSYHKNRNCQYIRNKQVSQGSIQDAINHNHADPCDKCAY